MTRKTLILSLAMVAGSLSTAQESRTSAPEVTAPTFHNTNCPIMGKPVSTRLFVDTEFGRIYVCCKGCNKKILSDPAKAHQSAYPTLKKVGNATCPISGEPVDEKSPKVVVQGHEIAICCEGCANAVRENSLVVLTRVTNPAVVDVGNATCPVTGKPVRNNVFVLVGDHLVRLSSTDCVEAVRKDPKAALTKAREIKASEPKAAESRPAKAGGEGAGKQ